MTKIYLTSIKSIKNEITITDLKQIHYLKNVLRVKINEKLLIFDELGYEYQVLICAVLNDCIKFTVTACEKKIADKKFKITLACAIPKKSKIEEIIDKLTQLGVDRIIPLITERVVVRLNEKKISQRLKRWQKIALSAAQQSQRNDLPQLDCILSLKEVLDESANYDLKLIPCLIKARTPVNQILSQPRFKNILVLIGPEGDFTPEEVELARSYGFIPVFLGDYVLRVETAAIAVASYLRFLFL